jgi:hypothetical protein
MDKDGEWKVMKWPEKRLGLHLKPDGRHNPDAAFRPQTEKMLEEIRRIWPGRAPKNRRPDSP